MEEGSSTHASDGSQASLSLGFRFIASFAGGTQSRLPGWVSLRALKISRQLAPSKDELKWGPSLVSQPSGRKVSPPLCVELVRAPSWEESCHPLQDPLTCIPRICLGIRDRATVHVHIIDSKNHMGLLLKTPACRLHPSTAD